MPLPTLPLFALSLHLFSQPLGPVPRLHLLVVTAEGAQIAPPQGTPMPSLAPPAAPASSRDPNGWTPLLLEVAVGAAGTGIFDGLATIVDLSLLLLLYENGPPTADGARAGWGISVGVLLLASAASAALVTGASRFTEEAWGRGPGNRWLGFLAALGTQLALDAGGIALMVAGSSVSSTGSLTFGPTAPLGALLMLAQVVLAPVVGVWAYRVGEDPHDAAASSPGPASHVGLGPSVAKPTANDALPAVPWWLPLATVHFDEARGFPFG